MVVPENDKKVQTDIRLYENKNQNAVFTETSYIGKYNYVLQTFKIMNF